MVDNFKFTINKAPFLFQKTSTNNVPFYHLQPITFDTLPAKNEVSQFKVIKENLNASVTKLPLDNEQNHKNLPINKSFVLTENKAEAYQVKKNEINSSSSSSSSTSSDSTDCSDDSTSSSSESEDENENNCAGIYSFFNVFK